MSLNPNEGDCIDYSVAIPAFGDAALLAHTLRSVLAQQWPADMRWEIVVNDDASDPPLRSKLNEFEGLVRFERNEQRVGWPENWNRTLEKARGTWVHMLHTDDNVLPDFARTMWDLARRHPRAAYIHSAVKARVLRQPLVGRFYNWVRGIGATRQPIGEALVYRAGPEAARHALSQGVRIVTIVVRREAAMSIGGFRKDLASMSDEEYVVRLAQIGDVVYCSKALCLYTYHSAQLSLSTWLEPNFVGDYLHVHEEALKDIGAAATDADRDTIRQRVAGVACGVARARALAGKLDLAAAALDDAVRLSPSIAQTRSFRAAKVLVRRSFVRSAYRFLVVGC